MTVRERLTDTRQKFTKSEVKVVRELLANYPVGGLTTVSGLARRAHVSDPTVVRLAHKLGFDGFGDLQNKLLAEVEAHLNSPLTILAGRRNEAAKDDDLLQHFLDRMAASTRGAGTEIMPAQFAAAAGLLVDRRNRVLCLGGRFSRHLAGVLRSHLQQLRSGVELLQEPEVELADRLIDVGRRDVSSSTISVAISPTSCISRPRPTCEGAKPSSSPTSGYRRSHRWPTSFCRFRLNRRPPSTR